MKPLDDDFSADVPCEEHQLFKPCPDIQRMLEVWEKMDFDNWQQLITLQTQPKEENEHVEEAVSTTNITTMLIEYRDALQSIVNQTRPKQSSGFWWAVSKTYRITELNAEECRINNNFSKKKQQIIADIKYAIKALKTTAQELHDNKNLIMLAKQSALLRDKDEEDFYIGSAQLHEFAGNVQQQIATLKNQHAALQSSLDTFDDPHNRQIIELKHECRSIENLYKSTEQLLIDAIAHQARMVIEMLERFRKSVAFKIQSPWVYNRDFTLDELSFVVPKTQQDNIKKLIEQSQLLLTNIQPLVKDRSTETTRADTFTYLPHIIERADEQLNMYLEKCNRIRTGIVSHMTPNHELTVGPIMRSGFIKSGRAQLSSQNRIMATSGVGKRRLAHDITFCINGAESSYTGNVEFEEHPSQPDKLILKKHLMNGDQFGVGFVFTYCKVIEGRLFNEERNSSGSHKTDGALELHLYNQDPNNDLELDIEDGIFIASEAERDWWIAFLTKPIEDEGCGKNLQWIEQFVRFYPRGTTPHFFVHQLQQKMQIPPKGHYKKTDKYGVAINDMPTTLFEWKSLNIDNA